MTERIERCLICDDPTGRAGRWDDSIYAGDIGPWCESCWDAVLSVATEWAGVATTTPLTPRDARVAAHLRALAAALDRSRAWYQRELEASETGGSE